MTANRGIDADFLDLPRQELADAALSAARAAGASYADLRIHRISTEIVQLRDGELETAVLSRDIGLAVRVIVAGTWGFASHAELSPEVAARTARHAVQVATIAGGAEHRTRQAWRPSRCTPTRAGSSDYQIDPFGVPASEKIACCEEYSGRLLDADGVDHVSASLTAVKEQTFYADTFGSSITQQRVRLQPHSRRWPSTPRRATSTRCARWRRRPHGAGKRWPATTSGTGPTELAELPDLLDEKVTPPSWYQGRRIW